MNFKKIGMVLLAFILLLISMVAMAADVQTTIEPKQDVYYVREGKTVSIGVTVSPRAARTKGVTFASDNEAVATVSSRGKVTPVSVGSCNIIVTSQYDPSVSVEIPLLVIVPAQKITFAMEQPTVRVGESIALSLSFEPQDTTLHSAIFKTGNKYIATVDERGVVTGVKAGKTNITATTTDGSKVSTRITVHVVQPVTGVSFRNPHARVGAKSYATFTATLTPKNATDQHMTWISDDPSIATVSGDTNRVRVNGEVWGQTVIRGVTEDGGYETSFVIDVGSLPHAVRVSALSVKDGRPRITLHNASNMEISQIRYHIRGFDAQGNQIKMAEQQNAIIGSYDLPLAPDESTEHGRFVFNDQIKYSGLSYFELAITGWTCEDGYYLHDGSLSYKYSIEDGNREWISSLKKK